MRNPLLATKTKSKIKLSNDMRSSFLDYALNRRNKNDYHYLTEKILLNVFDFMVNHNLTVHNNAKSYYYLNGKIQDLCFGFSGRDINYRMADAEEIIETLYHEVFCCAEYLARCYDSYPDGCKAYFGRNYKLLLI